MTAAACVMCPTVSVSEAAQQGNWFVFGLAEWSFRTQLRSVMVKRNVVHEPSTTVSQREFDLHQISHFPEAKGREDAHPSRLDWRCPGKARWPSRTLDEFVWTPWALGPRIGAMSMPQVMHNRTTWQALAGLQCRQTNRGCVEQWRERGQRDREGRCLWHPDTQTVSLVKNNALTCSTSFVVICLQLHDAPRSFQILCCGTRFHRILLVVETEEPGWKHSNPWCAEMHIIVAADVSKIFIHSADTDGTLLYTRSPPLPLTWGCWSFLLLK